MTIKELAAKKAKEAAAAASKAAVLAKGGKEATQAEKEAAAKIDKEFYEALANKDTAKLRELQADIAKQYEAKGQSIGGGTPAGSQGGFLVPTTLDSQIREKLYEISPLRSIATVISNLAADLELPFEGALPTTYWVGEGVAPTESGSTFSTKKLKAHKVGGFGKFTHESLVDTASNPSLQNFVAERFALSIALKETEAFVNGDGTDRPFGFRSAEMTPQTYAIPVGQSGVPAYDDLVKASLKVKKPYRQRGTWLVSTNGLAAILTLKDGAGRPIYLPSLTEGTPSTLLGRPVVEVEEIPSALGTGNNETEIWFGDFSNYIIGDREATRIAFGTTGTDLESDKISLVIFKRVAGLPTFGEAFVKITRVK